MGMLTESVSNYKRVSEKNKSNPVLSPSYQVRRQSERMEQETVGSAPAAPGYTDNPARQQERQRSVEQQRREPTAVAIPTEWKRDAAQKMYDAYIQSDEYKQNLAASMRAQTDEWMQATLAGSEGYTPTPRKDKKEQELKALVDHYTAQMEQEANQATLEQAMRELEMWSPEERKMLEMYWAQDTWERQHPMSDPITGGSRQMAGEIAAPLFAKYGEAAVRRMAEALEWQQSEEAAETARSHGQEMAGGTFFDNVGADLLSIGEKGVGNLTGAMGYITELGRRTGQFSTLNPNNIGQLPNVHGDAIQGQKAENLAADGSKWDAYVYKGATSAADSALRMAMGGGPVGGAALAATGSFARSVSEASARGASPAEAAAYGAATAGIEYLTEKLPLDNLMEAAKTGGHTLKEIAKSVLIQGGIEATEEELSLIGTTLAEAGILKEKAGYQQRINELVAGGMPLAEAQNAAFSELMEEAKETAIVSALSGGLSEAGASVAGNLTHRAADRAEDAAEMQQTEENAAENAAPVKGEPEAAVTPEEAAEQLGRESPKAEPVQKTEGELGIDRAYEATVGNVQKPTEQLTPQERGIRYKASKVNTAILDLVDRVKRGLTKGSEKVNLGTVSDANASQIQRETGIDTRGYSVAIEARQIEHILKDHGENGRSNQSMANPEDIARIEYALNNPDRISKSDPTKAYVTNRDGKMKPADTVLYETRLEDGSYYVVQAVPETKKRTLYIVSAFIGKSDYKNEAPQSTDAADPGATPEAKSTVTPEGATQSTDTNSPGATSEADSAGASKNILPQQEKEVNGNVDESRAQGVDSLETSAEGRQPGTKGTGAAEQNFSGKAAYQDLLTDDNAQPDRPGDVRPMELPKRDINGDNVSAVTGNVYGSKITPDEFASLMEEPTARGDFSYVKITNEQAVERAKETIAGAETWENAYKEWSNEVALGTAGPEMSARGALLLNHAAKQGNKGEWLSILSDLQKLGTNTAQGLQAMRIIRRLNPADRATIIKNQVRSMVRDMKLGDDIRPDEGLLNKYVQAKTEKERDAILEEIQQNVADQIPSTFLDKFTALRYMNMLGNIKANVRNIGGNAAMQGIYRVKDTMAAGVEEVLHKASGGKFEKTKSLTVSRELREACKADFAQYAGIVSDGGKFGDRQSGSNDFAQGVMDKRRIFKGNVDTKNEKFNTAANKVIDTALTPMEWYRKGTNWAMNNKYFGDEAFGRGAYARAMAGYLKAHGVKGGDLSTVNEALLDKARAYAIQEAQEATFHDNTALARIVQRGQKNFGIVGEGIMPFTKTPANILVRAEEFSPLGLINSTVKTVRATKKDSQITGADIVNSWAKTLTGTAIFALGAVLKDQGWLTASGDDDEEKAAFDKLNGEQEYALMLPDGSNYTLDFLGPAVMPLFMGAELSKAIEEAGGFDELTWADWENILTSVSDPMLQMSMLSGINDSLSNIKYADNSLIQFCINAAVSYLTQGLGNTLMGQIEKSTEKVRTQTYIDKDSQMPQWMQKQLGSLSQKIPLWDFQQTPYIDARGREQEQRTDLGGWLYNLVSPGYLDKKEVDAVSAELYRLHETGEAEEAIFPETPATTFSYTDKDGVKHEDYSLTAEEAEALKRRVGETYMDTLKALFENDTYKAMTDRQKTDAAKYAEDYAREKGRTEAVQGYEGMSDWMKSIDGDAAEVIIRKTTEGAFADAFSLMETDPERAAAALDQAYGLVDQHGITEWAQEAGGKTEHFINARRREVDASTFCGLYQKYREIDKDASLDVGQKAQEWADYLQKTQEAGAITESQKKALKKDMAFYYNRPAGTEKYDTMVELGVDSDNADMIAHLLDGIDGTGKGGDVTDADKWRAIATSKLPDKELDTVMKAYMDDYDPKAKKPDYTEVKYDYIRQELGLSAEEYVDTYKAVQKGNNKNEDIANLKALGYDHQTATALYDIYNSTKKGKKAYMGWYEELYG